MSTKQAHFFVSKEQAHLKTYQRLSTEKQNGG